MVLTAPVAAQPPFAAFDRASAVAIFDMVNGKLVFETALSPFSRTEGVAVWGNSYFFADSDNNRVVKYVVVVNLGGNVPDRAAT